MITKILNLIFKPIYEKQKNNMENMILASYISNDQRILLLITLVKYNFIYS